MKITANMKIILVFFNVCTALTVLTQEECLDFP